MLEALNPGTALLLLLAAGAAIGYSRWRGLRHEWAAFRAWQAAGSPAAIPVQAAHEQPAALAALPADPLPRAGAALAKPPADYRIVIDATRAKGPGRYRIPLGWYASVDGAELQTAQLQGDVNHILITGTTDTGKDNAVLGIFLALAHDYPPARVQFAILDGKGLDWMDWDERAHTWLLAMAPEQIAGAMAALTAERERRGKILQAAGAKKWDVYKGDDLPLLVVYVAELLLLQNATSKAALTAWLNSELTAARAFGIRYIVGCQNVSNFDTQWRSQISLYLAGYQTLPSSDAPNIGMSADEAAERLGVVAPSRLPPPTTGAAGVFCAIQGGHGVNVRTTLIPDQQAEYLIRQLPAKALQAAPVDRPAPLTPAAADDPVLRALLAREPLPFEDEAEAPATAAFAHQNAEKRTEAPRSGSTPASVTGSLEALPVAVDVVPADEQRAILELARRVNSRRALCKQLYNSTGGAGYEKVQAVCDAAGLLVRRTAAAGGRAAA